MGLLNEMRGSKTRHDEFVDIPAASRCFIEPQSCGRFHIKAKKKQSEQSKEPESRRTQAEESRKKTAVEMNSGVQKH